MNTSSLTQTRGFTLLEMTVVLLLMTLLASVAIRETNGLSFQVRYEQTRERLERIREAILGNPRRIINGQQAVSGFVADMGRLPGSIRELIQLSSYCSDTTKLTKADCENTPGTVWFGRKSYGFCSLTFPNESQCLANSGSWTHLFYGGWNGPYLNISGNPADSDAFTDGWGRPAQGYCSDITHTNETACVMPAIWTPPANDTNYGWYYDTETYANGLRIQSYGKDHVYAGSDYDVDYPALETQPAVKGQDWLVDISGGVNVNFIKSTEKLPPISLCSDPIIPKKADCESAGKIWYGGCNQAGYFNKNSCTAASGTWTACSDGASATRSDCELAGKIWYGEGFGCSDQSKSNKTLCSSPDVWRSCTDDGTITTESACLSANQIWYGDNIFSLSNRSDSAICMKIFYRKPDSSIGVLVSDEDDATVNNDPKLIIADGSFQTIRFAKFRDSASGLITNDIPIGTNAIGIYKHNGTCTDIHYPTGRQTPIQVDFHPRTGLPVINW